MKKTFTGNTRLFLCISGAIIVVALIMQLCGVGLNLGIDFTGGSILEYSVGEDYDVADVETILYSVGFEDAQITKAAPSAASEALQADRAEAPAEETAEETSEETTEETAEEPVAEIASILSMDKSGVKADGLTDLQIRLNLVDEAANMEGCAVEAVQSVVSGATLPDSVVSGILPLSADAVATTFFLSVCVSAPTGEAALSPPVWRLTMPIATHKSSADNTTVI